MSVTCWLILLINPTLRIIHGWLLSKSKAEPDLWLQTQWSNFDWNMNKHDRKSFWTGILFILHNQLLAHWTKRNLIQLRTWNMPTYFLLKHELICPKLTMIFKFPNQICFANVIISSTTMHDPTHPGTQNKVKLILTQLKIDASIAKMYCLLTNKIIGSIIGYSDVIWTQIA